MNFSLSTGIYRVDQHKKLSLIVLLFMAPVIVGAVYVVWNSLAQAGEIEIGQSISDFFYYLYQEQVIFLVLFTGLALAIPLFFISVYSRTSAYIKIDDQGFEYKLPLLARELSNGFSPTHRIIPWSEVSGINAYQGKKSQIKGIKGVPSSRLNTAKIEIITNDFRLYINPYKWLQEGRDDHRLSIQEAASLSENATNSAFEFCPLMAAFNSFKQFHFFEGA